MYLLRHFFIQGTVVGAIATLLASCSTPTLPRPTVEPLPQDPNARAYFNGNPAAAYRDPYRQQARLGDNLEQAIAAEIAKARISADVAVQEFRLPAIAAALAERHAAGVRVRVVLENSYNRDYTEVESPNQLDEDERERYATYRLLVDENGDGRLAPEEIARRDALAVLRNAGIPILDDTADGSKGSGLMHHKFAVIDDRTLLVSSANYTLSGIHGDFGNLDTRGNANNLLVFESPELASYFTAEFELMWGDGPGGNPDSRFGKQKPPRSFPPVPIGNGTVSVRFSPSSAAIPWAQSSNGAIATTLQNARQSADLALFVFSEQKIADALASARQNGTEVRALIDPSFAFRPFSEGLDLLGIAIAPQGCQHEPDNRPWTPPISTVGFPALPAGDKLHHKFAIADGRTVITGSHNWSAAANENNDETLLFINNPTVVRHFQREFDRLFAIAQLGIPDWVQKRIDEQKQQCPTFVTPSLTGAPAGKININTSTQKQLETLPGIGPVAAQRIIQGRPFSSPEDLQRVKGIGAKTVEKLRDRIAF